MAHTTYCDYRPPELMGIGCICEFIEVIRKNERKYLAKVIGAEVLHQKSDGEFSTCKGCRQWPCELDGEQ